MTPQERSQALRARARELGFAATGFAPAQEIDPEGRLQAWLAQGFQGPMTYMARSVAEREDVRRLVPGARTVVALAMPYRAERRQGPGPKISRYVTARDYHGVMRKRLRRLRRFVLELAQDAAVKPTVDTSPVLERAWAQRAGIGWIGKSTMLIGTSLGTYTFLGTLITDLEFAYDTPHPDRCGSCTRCLDACPTQAFPEPGVLDARKCITTWTVENRGAAEADLPDLHGWVAGCDVCQEVCPWNKYSGTPIPELASAAPLEDARWEDLTRPRAVEPLIKGTALQRTGAEAIARNARRARSRSGS